MDQAAKTKLRLDSIAIRGFKSIASLEVQLRPVNLLIGANGSGKSNFLDAFAFLQAIFDGRLRNYVAAAGGAEKVLRFGSKVTNEMFLRISGTDKRSYEVVLSPTATDSLFVALEVGGWPSAGGTSPASDAWRVYHFLDTSTSSPLRKTAAVDDNRFLREDGANLAAFLYLLRRKHEAAYQMVRSVVQSVAPFFDDFELSPTPENAEYIKLEWRHKNRDGFFGASALSDGTLRFMALATLLLQPEESLPPVLLIDEPELGLHPRAIEALASLIKQSAVTSQAIVSTQSPLLIDYFDPQDVLVADRVNGSTELHRLQSTDLEFWLKEYSLGQLWEKNEFAGRPVPE